VPAPVPDHIAAFWQSFAATQAVDPTPRFLEAFFFDDNERSANELARLVLAGRKRASAALLWSFEKAGAPVPQAGDLSVVTNFSREPLCVIETRRVDIVPFEEVNAEFAAVEGEGDGSLDYWRSAHTAYFGRECERIGRVAEARMPVVCERFEVIYRTGRKAARL
jgi:uncharacterized protein YhfF